MGLKTDTKRDRPLRIVAGPAAGLDPINLVIPLDQTAARSRRVNHRYRAEAALIGPRDWPITLRHADDLERVLRMHRKRKSNFNQEPTT
jgi:hypothetical protein